MKHYIIAALLLTFFTLSSLAQLNCDYIDPICQKARELMEQGQYKNAITGLQKAKNDEGISNCPDIYKIDNLIGVLQNRIYEKEQVDEQALFIGGSTAMNQWLAKNIRYPAVAQVNNIQGRVTVHFVVELDGRITNVMVVRGVDQNLDNEAVRVVKAMPRWNPGMLAGIKVRSRVYVPVNFKIITKTPPAPRATTEGPRGVIPEAAEEKKVATSTPVQPALRDRTFTVNGVSFKMVAVEGGTFTMGATSEQDNPYSGEKPAHRVTLSDYYIGETELTQALWRAVMGSNPSYFKGDNLPVGHVSWDDCQTFIRKLNAATGKNFRLPTEAEWEFAARGGNKSYHTKYAGGSDLSSVAWCYDNSDDKTHPVAQKSPNELGLYDMSGNVWEWCQDYYDSDYYSRSPSTNPCNNTKASYRVLRGGSWHAYARECRVANRLYLMPGNRFFNLDLGLRLTL